MNKKRNVRISVVIPTYNSWNSLKSCITSIQNQSLRPQETIVVDNGSKDRTSESVRKYFPKVKLFSLKTNTGVTGGRNKGIEESSESDFIFFFDHDMVAEKNMLEKLIEVAVTDPDIGIVTPKIYYYGNKKRIWSAGTGINLWTGQVLFRGGIDKGQFDKVEEVQVAPAAILVKKEVIKDLKKFDDTYFATYEDTDFCFRAKRAGYKVFYAPQALAFHKIPLDSQEESVRLLSRAYWIGRNRILFMKDFGNNFYIFLLFLPIFLVYYLKLAISYGRFSDWLSLVQGTWVGLTLSIFSKKIIFSGERPSLSDLDGQHLAKYKFALAFCKGKKVLEIGCGSGYGSKYLADHGVGEISAFDVDQAAISFAIKNYSHENVKFAEGDAETLKVNSSYDVVLSFEVIEHLKHPEKLLRLAQESLKKRGIFILSTPNKEFSVLDNGKPSNPYHIYEYYPGELKIKLLEFFKSVQLYGVVLKNREIADQEKQLHHSLWWQLINQATNRRLVRRVMNYLPEYPKRLISGESKLSFKTEDFQVLKNRVEESTDFVAVCR